MGMSFQIRSPWKLAGWRKLVESKKDPCPGLYINDTAEFMNEYKQGKA